MQRKRMAIVRPYNPNFAEMAVYSPFLANYAVSFFFTGPDIDDCRVQLDALGLQQIEIVRYSGYTDLVRASSLQRVLDFKVGFGSYMLSKLHDLMSRYECINIVDPIYAHAHQIVNKMRPNQSLTIIRWENIYDRYRKVWRAAHFSDEVLARADHIICVSDASLNTLDLPPGARAEVTRIYPGIKIPPTIQRSSSRNSDVPLILFVGREQWSKGLDMLLAAFRILTHKMRKPAKLGIVGISAVSLKSKTTTLGISGNVQLFGRLSNQQVRSIMWGADIFCFPSLLSPSWSEQFGFAMVEAMAHALPVVAFDSGCIREICGPDGVYAAAGNSYALAESLASVIEDPEDGVRRGQRLRERAQREFSSDLQGRKMMEFLS